MFGASLKQLLWMTQTMASMLDAGLPVSRVLDVLQEQAGSGVLRRRLREVGRRVSGGATLAEAFSESGRWPSLFIRFIAIGERTGRLDTVTAELADFYETSLRVRRSFRAKMALPVMEYIAAVALGSIAFYLLNGVLGHPTHLMRNMSIGYGVPLVLLVLWWLMRREVIPGRWAQELLLRVPGLGSVFRTAALARFSRCMRLTLDAGLPVTEALDCSLQATDNAAFVARFPWFERSVQEGQRLTEAFGACSLFPPEFVHPIAVGEESGKLTEKFEWLARNYTEEFERRLNAFATFAAWAVYGLVALFIIIMIFKLFMMYAEMAGGLAGGTAGGRL